MTSSSPSVRSLAEILPEDLPLLMGSGPVPIPKEVAAANQLVINHLGESMNKVVSGIVEMGQYIFQTQTNKIFGIAGPSSAAMEMAISSLLWKGRKVLVLNLGVFSARFTELARGVDADVTELFPEPLSPFKPEAVKAALAKNHYDVLALVHGEVYVFECPHAVVLFGFFGAVVYLANLGVGVFFSAHVCPPSVQVLGDGAGAHLAEVV